jgi:hypothetical protein
LTKSLATAEAPQAEGPGFGQSHMNETFTLTVRRLTDVRQPSLIHVRPAVTQLGVAGAILEIEQLDSHRHAGLP